MHYRSWLFQYPKLADRGQCDLQLHGYENQEFCRVFHYVQGAAEQLNFGPGGGAMSKINRKSEQGVSLLLAMLALMILSAVAFGMMYMSSTETAINSNFKTQEVAY